MDKTEEGGATFAWCEGCRQTLPLEEWTRHQSQLASGKECEAEEVPSAYIIVEMNGQYYPLRFGRFRLSAGGTRIWLHTYKAAAAYCRLEQTAYERAYPVRESIQQLAARLDKILPLPDPQGNE